MKWLSNLSLVSRISLAMILAISLNFSLGYFLKKRLSKNAYLLQVVVHYDQSGTMEFYYDTGNGFNSTQGIVKSIQKGQNEVAFPFNVEKEGVLKFIRLDFGNDSILSEVKIDSMYLSSGGKRLFNLESNTVSKKISLLQGVEQVDHLRLFKIETAKRPFDPYIVFNPINELVYPLWQRTLLLIGPWFLLLLLPIIKWMRERIENKEFLLILVALFFAAIPLKIAWVTFTSLLLSAFAIITYLRKREFRLSPGRYAILGLFFISALFLDTLEPSRLGIPIGFVIFSLVFSILDFSQYFDKIKIIYTKVFFVLMSIIGVSWLLFAGYKGYFYGIQFVNYFDDIKSNAHVVMEWLYYSHTTFLSFFMLIGGLFCLDLFRHNKINKTYAIGYFVLLVIALLVLGSRFNWFLALLLPLLYAIPIRILKIILLPLWVSIFAGTVFFIGHLDALRDELWRISFTQIKENIWFGKGTGNSDIHIPSQFVIDKNGVETWIEINHSHNQFLTYLLESGVLGLVLFVVLMLYIWRQFSKENNKVMLLLFFSILLLMIIESPFKTTTPLFLFSFLWCCFLSVDKK